VLTRLLPSLALGKGVVQNPYHHLDVFGHSLACVDALGEIAADPEVHLGPRGQEVGEYLSKPLTRALIMTAGLLHDLGKPPTAQEKEPGWSTFHRHDTLGASLARQAARSLGIPKAGAARIASLVGGHMRPFHLLGAEKKVGLTKRAVRRLLADAGEDLAGLFTLAMADTMAGKGPLRPQDAEARLARLFSRVCDLRDVELAAALAAPPLINGHDLLTTLEMSPGPEVGRLLNLVREAQLDGEVKDRAEALDLARSLHQDDQS
jgi:poly(A) polymerase